MGLSSFLCIALWLLEIVAAKRSTAPHEVDAINKIINHWGLSSKLNLSGTDPCIENAPWAPQTANPRIACDCSDETPSICHITHLKIYALDISGEIPPELFNLTELTDLNLNQNVLSGPIPPAFGKLSKMQYLALGINNLTGPVPAELGDLTGLIVLSFSSNNLQGPLPRELGKLTSLRELYIDSSGVSGTIPQEFSNWNKSFKILWASDNRFTGKIPEFLGSLTNLADLRLEGTNLEGPIPSSFGALTKLKGLRIGDLGGTNDSSLGFLDNLTSLSILLLRNCRIGGTISEKLSSFSNLMILDLSFNKLTGQIPAFFKNLSSLQFLYLGSNKLSGELPDIRGSKTSALDVSFNIALTGNVSLHGNDISINVVGTSVNDANLNKTASDMLRCLQGITNCAFQNPSTEFTVNSGGHLLVSVTNKSIIYANDSEILGAASLYTSTDNLWAVSVAGVPISNPNGIQSIAKTDSQFLGTDNSELYQTARIAPNSLRYYGYGLKNGAYQVELHFAEIQMDDSSVNSWRGLARRLFDVYIQGERVLQDFNIVNEAGGSKEILIKTFNTTVNNTAMDIHLLWAGKGTCCIPFQSTYGPLISAVRVTGL